MEFLRVQRQHLKDRELLQQTEGPRAGGCRRGHVPWLAGRQHTAAHWASPTPHSGRAPSWWAPEAAVQGALHHRLPCWTLREAPRLLSGRGGWVLVGKGPGTYPHMFYPRVSKPLLKVLQPLAGARGPEQRLEPSLSPEPCLGTPMTWTPNAMQSPVSKGQRGPAGLGNDHVASSQLLCVQESGFWQLAVCRTLPAPRGGSILGGGAGGRSRSRSVPQLAESCRGRSTPEGRPRRHRCWPSLQVLCPSLSWPPYS